MINSKEMRKLEGENIRTSTVSGALFTTENFRATASLT